MSYENISASLSAADQTLIESIIDNLVSRVPVLVNLSEEERQEFYKMGDKSLAFATKGVEYAQSHPQFMPKDVDIQELVKDFKYNAALRLLLQWLKPFVAALEDTEIATGAETMKSVLAFYGGVRSSSERNSPGAREIYSDMRARFPSISTGRPKNSPEEEVK